MKSKTSAMILALLFAGSAEAVRYRPFVDGRTPWYKTSPGVAPVDFPHDYKVSDFGVDHEIKSSLAHTAAAEAKLGEWKNAAKPPPGPPPRDYFVPNFGEDSDIKYTKAHTAAAETSLGHTMQASFTPPPPPPQNYFVPNFGQDFDVKETLKHAGAAEATLGHKWQNAGQKPAPPGPSNYFVPNFGEDTDVKYTKAHLAAAENKLGHNMKASFSQPEGPPQNYAVPDFGQDHDIKDSLKHTQMAESRLGEWKNAAAKPPGPPPQDYFVPNFGLDKDIKDSLAHTSSTETKLGHKMSAGQLEARNDYELLRTHADMHLESDPICSSAGCGQYKHKKAPRGYDINYFVPNFGVDTDITDSHASLGLAEGALAHKLEMGTEKSKAKWHNVAKDTDYNFAPKLDADMIHTAKHLGDAESSLGHRWVIDG